VDQEFAGRASICVKINDESGPFFKAGKALKQGDPISPILFNLVANVFTKVLSKAPANVLIKSLLPHVIPGGVSSLQYADDTKKRVSLWLGT
jgi:hypothetical protein